VTSQVEALFIFERISTTEREHGEARRKKKYSVKLSDLRDFVVKELSRWGAIPQFRKKDCYPHDHFGTLKNR
jgi:hypothetical protein